MGLYCLKDYDVGWEDNRWLYNTQLYSEPTAVASEDSCELYPIVEKKSRSDKPVERVFVVAREVTVHLCLVTARTDWVAELVLCESVWE